MVSQLPEFLTEKKHLFPLDPKPRESRESPLLIHVKPLLAYVSFFHGVLSFRKRWVLLQQLQRECPIIFFTESISKDFASVELLYSIS